MCIACGTYAGWFQILETNRLFVEKTIYLFHYNLSLSITTISIHNAACKVMAQEEVWDWNYLLLNVINVLVFIIGWKCGLDLILSYLPGFLFLHTAISKVAITFYLFCRCLMKNSNYNLLKCMNSMSDIDQII